MTECIRIWLDASMNGASVTVAVELLAKRFLSEPCDATVLRNNAPFRTPERRPLLFNGESA
jgi:hypothetical protein